MELNEIYNEVNLILDELCSWCIDSSMSDDKLIFLAGESSGKIANIKLFDCNLYPSAQENLGIIINSLIKLFYHGIKTSRYLLKDEILKLKLDESRLLPRVGDMILNGKYAWRIREDSEKGKYFYILLGEYYRGYIAKWNVKDETLYLMSSNSEIKDTDDTISIPISIPFEDTGHIIEGILNSQKDNGLSIRPEYLSKNY